METRNQVIALAATLGLIGVNSGTSVPASDFSSTTIDLGVVVSDIDKSAAFYEQALGFEERDGFEVPPDFCRDAGLTDGLPLVIRVFVLGEGDQATKLKLMQVEGAKPKPTDNAFIHSQLGFSYLTVYVNDTAATLERCAGFGVKPIAKGPLPIGPTGEGNSTPHLSIVRDPDGNLIELIGPQK